MEHLQVPKLLDEHGQPLSTHIDDALRGLAPRLRREFPAVQDEVDLTEILETAGRRIERREQRAGPIERLHGYAWAALQSIAKSWMRRGANRLMRRTVAPESSEGVLATVPTRSGSPEEIEQTILIREVMAHLTEEHINRVLVECQGDVSGAARVLGIHRRSLQRKLARYPSRR